MVAAFNQDYKENNEQKAEPKHLKNLQFWPENEHVESCGQESYGH
jgi:hypothetical protein